MSRRRARSWIDLALRTAQLGFEAQSVIGLRLLKVAAGGRAAEAEMRRMASEKAAALVEAAATLAAGGSPGKVVRRYRSHVRANRRRLMRPGSKSKR